jgi:uncharacterized repeat protein (TIGR03837 family)
MPPHRVWDIFCTVIDNHGDLGVCWRLAADLASRGQQVRLWVDDASALAWMAPQGCPGVQVRRWADAQVMAEAPEPATDVLVEAFGCEIPEAFVAATVHSHASQAPRVWINLEYLSAEPYVERSHGLPSPVMSGPARGWTKHFFYPGFTQRTGGLLRESDLMARQRAFMQAGRTAWRHTRCPGLPHEGRLISLFCYEPAGLPQLLARLPGSTDRLLVTPGRALAAVGQACRSLATPPAWTALPATDQAGFDQMLWGCDLNLVRGEDSLVRALWAAQPFIWQIYPQDDGAHQAKLEAFLDWLQAPESLRRFHRVWNGLEPGDLPALTPQTLLVWAQTAQAARERLLAQMPLSDQLMRWVQVPRHMT